MRIVCMPRKFSLGKTENKVAWNENWATQQGRAGETHYAHWVPLRHLHGWSQKRNAELGQQLPRLVGRCGERKQRTPEWLAVTNL